MGARFPDKRLFTAILAAGLMLPAAAFAGGAITVENPYARPPMGGGKVAAAYMTLVNAGKEDDRLVRAEGDVAGRIELHTHIMEKAPDGGTIMKMRQVPFMQVPAGGRTELKPGGLHIMLIGVTKPIKPGDAFDLTLVFEKAGKVKVTVPVKKLSATMMHGMKPGMKQMKQMKQKMMHEKH